jgi:hypothetical protein
LAIPSLLLAQQLSLTIMGSAVAVSAHDGHFVLDYPAAQRITIESSRLGSQLSATSDVRFAQRRRSSRHHGSEAPTPEASTSSSRPPSAEASSGPPISSEPASEAPSSEAPPSDAPTDESDGEPDLELLRQRARLTRVHRSLGIATWASLGVTTVLGTMLAINQPTWFGNGLCNNTDGYAVLGDFGCGPLPFFHEASAFITLSLYATTGGFALAMPDPEHASVGTDGRAVRLRWHKAMAWIHVIGMVVEPLLGIASLLSIPSDAQLALRTIHLGVGYVTFAALTTAMILEF